MISDNFEFTFKLNVDGRILKQNLSSKDCSLYYRTFHNNIHLGTVTNITNQTKTTVTFTNTTHLNQPSSHTVITPASQCYFFNPYGHTDTALVLLVLPKYGRKLSPSPLPLQHRP